MDSESKPRSSSADSLCEARVLLWACTQYMVSGSTEVAGANAVWTARSDSTRHPSTADGGATEQYPCSTIAHMACRGCVLLWAFTWYVLACNSELAGLCYSDGMGRGAHTMQRSVRETATIDGRYLFLYELGFLKQAASPKTSQSDFRGGASFSHKDRRPSLADIVFVGINGCIHVGIDVRSLWGR